LIHPQCKEKIDPLLTTRLYGFPLPFPLFRLLLFRFRLQDRFLRHGEHVTQRIAHALGVGIAGY
jgi:hypothetical protein